jgi:hypothetical protein
LGNESLGQNNRRHVECPTGPEKRTRHQVNIANNELFLCINGASVMTDEIAIPVGIEELSLVSFSKARKSSRLLY